MINKGVNVAFDNTVHLQGVPTDQNGIALIESNAAKVIKINPGFALCQPHSSDYSWLAILNFPTDKILKEGIVAPNLCGKATASSKPGEIVLFVRPLTWWEELFKE